MFPSKTLISLLLIMLSTVDASPFARRDSKASLGFTTRINARGTMSIPEKDRARAQAMKQSGQLGKRSGYPVAATNNGVHYSVQVGIGSPATDYTLLIDTGSSNTFVGAGKAYVPTGTSQDTGHTVSVSYGSGGWSGKEYIDTVTLSSGLVISQQSIGVASRTTGFDGVDGIIGVGPIDLTKDTVSGEDTVPTVVDNLVAQGTIPQEVLGVYFVPASESTSTGELTFGGYDESAIIGPVIYTPLTTTSPASNYWGIDGSISYGLGDIFSTGNILPSTAGIVDTGTTLLLIATDAFQTYQRQTGGVMDNSVGLLKITEGQYSNLQSLIFNVGGVTFELSSNGQIWPRSLNTAIGGTSSGIYLIVSDIGTESGSGLDFILGYTFLERFYSVFDTTNQQVGLAYTKNTFSLSN